MHERFKNALTGVILIILFVIAQLVNFEGSFLIQFFTICGVLFHSYLLGTRLFPRAGGCVGTVIGVVLFFAMHSIGQTIWFYLGFSLGADSDLWITAGTMAACHLLTLWIAEPSHAEEERESNEPWKRSNTLRATFLFFASFAAFVSVMVGAFNSETIVSIRTPWPLLPMWTLFAVAAGWLAVLCSAIILRPNALSRSLIAVQSALAIAATTGIAPFVYKIGFGFDRFLHLAGEKQILATGMLAPKPFYYIGQYVLTTFLSRVSRIPIEQIDRWLVPIAAAILLPLAGYLAARSWHLAARDQSNPQLLAACHLLLPLAPFIATTPQSFSYLLGIAAVILALGGRTSHPITPMILAAWSIAAHPLAGVPLFCLVVALLLAKRSAVAWIFVLLSAAAIPALFFALSMFGGARMTWNLSAITTLDPWRDLLTYFTPWIGNRYVLWPAWASLVAKALPVIGLLGTIGTIALENRRSKSERHSNDVRSRYALLLGSGIFLFISGAILKFAGEFAFLIEYERGNYAERLAILATFLLAIGAFPFFAWLLDHAKSNARALLVPLVIGLLAIATAQSTNALPRHDALVMGHGWSVGAADLDAVKHIDRDAGLQPYTVLANQSVSAAAVSQFGFKRYNGDIFFYPIPTGGPLYQLYLDMTYTQPTRDVAKRAGKLGGSDLVYVVLNDYWWKAEELAESLAEIADANWVIGEPEKGIGTSVRIYKFDVKKSILHSFRTPLASSCKDEVFQSPLLQRGGWGSSRLEMREPKCLIVFQSFLSTSRRRDTHAFGS